MIDTYGRDISYLRVSLTKRCNLRCTYCAPECEKDRELTAKEIEKAVRAFAACGITKVRLTGGEPLLRQDICDIAERIKRIDAVKKLMLTTNGVYLKNYAESLKKAGVDGVNISLDTTDRQEYERLTGFDFLPRVLEGIEAAERAGLRPLRLNAVLIRGENDTAAAKLIEIARDKKIDVRFIELMPFSDKGEQESLVIKGEEILKAHPYLRPCDQKGKTDFEKSVARYYEAEGFLGRVGFITPVSDKFCSECNRIRLLSDGKVKPCLGSDEVYDIRPFLGDDEALITEIKRAILSKPLSHYFGCGYGVSHGLNKTGG